MKKINLIPFLIFIIIMLVNTDCKKENLQSRSTIQPPPPPPPPTPANTAPIASAGDDRLVFSPTDFCTLYGSSYDPENAFVTTQWNKISGPPSFLLIRSDVPETKVSKLEKGVYKFELTVTDAGGLTDKDTCTVIVGELPANPQEKIFNNLAWSCLWGCDLEIKNLYNSITPDHIFKVFIKSDNSAVWMEAFHWSSSFAIDYSYSFYNGDLWISYSGYDVNDTPDVKIVY